MLDLRNDGVAFLPEIVEQRLAVLRACDLLAEEFLPIVPYLFHPGEDLGGLIVIVL